VPEITIVTLFGDDPYCPIIQKGIDYEKYV